MSTRNLLIFDICFVTLLCLNDRRVSAMKNILAEFSLYKSTCGSETYFAHCQKNEHGLTHYLLWHALRIMI